MSPTEQGDNKSIASKLTLALYPLAFPLQSNTMNVNVSPRPSVGKAEEFLPLTTRKGTKVIKESDRSSIKKQWWIKSKSYEDLPTGSSHKEETGGKLDNTRTQKTPEKAQAIAKDLGEIALYLDKHDSTPSAPTKAVEGPAMAKEWSEETASEDVVEEEMWVEEVIEDDEEEEEDGYVEEDGEYEYEEILVSDEEENFHDSVLTAPESKPEPLVDIPLDSPMATPPASTGTVMSPAKPVSNLWSQHDSKDVSESSDPSDDSSSSGSSRSSSSSDDSNKTSSGSSSSNTSTSRSHAEHSNSNSTVEEESSPTAPRDNRFHDQSLRPQLTRGTSFESEAPAREDVRCGGARDVTTKKNWEERNREGYSPFKAECQSLRPQLVRGMSFESDVADNPVSEVVSGKRAGRCFQTTAIRPQLMRGMSIESEISPPPLSSERDGDDDSISQAADDEADDSPYVYAASGISNMRPCLTRGHSFESDDHQPEPTSVRGGRRLEQRSNEEATKKDIDENKPNEKKPFVKKRAPVKTKSPVTTANTKAPTDIRSKAVQQAPSTPRSRNLRKARNTKKLGNFMQEQGPRSSRVQLSVISGIGAVTHGNESDNSGSSNQTPLVRNRGPKPQPKQTNACPSHDTLTPTIGNHTKNKELAPLPEVKKLKSLPAAPLSPTPSPRRDKKATPLTPKVKSKAPLKAKSPVAQPAPPLSSTTTMTAGKIPTSPRTKSAQKEVTDNVGNSTATPVSFPPKLLTDVCASPVSIRTGLRPTSHGKALWEGGEIRSRRVRRMEEIHASMKARQQGEEADP